MASPFTMLINFVEPQSKHDRCKVTGEWFAEERIDNKTFFTQELLTMRKRFRSAEVAMRWQRRHRVRMLDKSHSPPPSMTGRMWSASQSDLRDRVRRPQCRSSVVRPAPREKRSCLAALIVSNPQSAQIPRSRSNTFSRRYAGCVLSFHSWTQNPEQKVYLPRGTSRAHQRQRPRPLGPRGINLRLTQPPFMARAVLTDLFLNREGGFQPEEHGHEYKDGYVSCARRGYSAEMIVRIRTACGPSAFNGSRGRFAETGYRARGFRVEDAARHGGGGASRR